MNRKNETVSLQKGAVVSVYLDADETEAVNDMASWMETSREEVIRRALLLVQSSSMILHCPSSWQAKIKIVPGT